MNHDERPLFRPDDHGHPHPYKPSKLEKRMTKNTTGYGPFEPVRVYENSKATDIRDAFNNLKYRVVMTSSVDVECPSVTNYKVAVINFFSLDDPIVIMTFPCEEDSCDVEEDRKHPITDIKEAEEIYQSCIRQYTLMVKAETRGFRDVDVNKDRFNYEIVCPKCCGTCLWCRKDKPMDDVILGISNRMKCYNPKHQIKIDNRKFSDQYRYDHPETFPGDRHFRERGRDIGAETVFILPKVDTFGCCPDYEKKVVDDYRPEPGDSLTRYIDRRIRKSTPDIIGEVGKIVDQKIQESSPIISGNKDLEDDDGNPDTEPGESGIVMGGGAA